MMRPQALVEVADDVAHVAVGDKDLQRADGLHQDGVRERQARLVRKSRGGLERHFGGVHVVVRAVDQGRLEPDHGVAGEHAVRHAVAQGPFQRRGWKFFGTLPPKIFSSNTNSSVSPGSNSTHTSPYWPCPPDCFLWRPCTLDLFLDLLAVGDLRGPPERSRRRTCFSAWSTGRPGGYRPCPTRSSALSRRSARPQTTGPPPQASQGRSRSFPRRP